MKALEKINKVAHKYNASAHQIALSWLLHHAPHILLIPGTSQVKHLEENFQAASVALSQEDVLELDKISAA